MKKRLAVIKQQATVWGTYCWGGIACHDKKVVYWDVVDTVSNKLISGGVVSGNNTMSGYAKYKTKKAAMAVVRGYEGFFSGLDRDKCEEDSSMMYGWELAFIEVNGFRYKRAAA